MATGPSTTTSPYLLASEPNVRFTSLITVNDPLPGDDGPFAGIPDGLGAFDNGDGTFTVLVNHELGGTVGVVRDHGAIGSFIDRLVIDKGTLAVVSSNDLIQTAKLYSVATDSYVTATTTFSRFCSGDLAEQSAFYDAATGLGTQVRIYLTGEESGVEGRGTATLVNGAEAGTIYELAALGNMSYENLTANPYAQTKTIVAMTDDGQNGQVYLYVGDKQASGSDIAKAGLANGDFYGIKVAGFTDETNAVAASGTFTLQQIGADGDVRAMTGAQIDAESEAEGVTSFLRPEDSAWDPDNPNTLYFTTTNSFTGNSRLYKLTFTDITHPELGGAIVAVLDGTEGQHMFDNLTVSNGKVILQEDPGNQSYLAKVYEYDIATDTLTTVARFDPALFTSGQPGFITVDEESSGVIDVSSILGDADTSAYLLDAQLHVPSGNPATVELGQLMVMYVDDPKLVGGNGNDELFGSAANETLTGGNGDDHARAGSGNDVVDGGNGNDRLDGGAGNDTLRGGNGDDQLTGGIGDDTLSGGRGADWFLFDNRIDVGNDRVLDFANADRLLTTVALADANHDGRIDVGVGGIIDTGQGGEIDLEGLGLGSSLVAFGTVNVGGTDYYSYGLAGGSGPGHFALDFHAAMITAGAGHA